jgi:hypothetical protein
MMTNCYCHKCDCSGISNDGECDGCDGRGMKFACRTCGCAFAGSKLDVRGDCDGCVKNRIAFKKRVRDEGIFGR